MEYLSWMGLLAFCIMMCYSGYPNRVRVLERKVKLLNNKLKGGNEMSKLLEELAGKKCKLKRDDSWEPEVTGKILSVDDEWIKLEINKKKTGKESSKADVTTKLYRVDSIICVDIVND